MRLARLVAGVAVLTATVALTEAPASMAVSNLPTVSELDPHQWGVPKPEANVYGADYQLYNLANGGDKHDLIDHHQTFGADVDFGDGEKVSTGLRQFSFKRRSRAKGRISPTQSIAIYDNFTHKYLVNEHQRFGVDLDWVANPSYQWHLLPGSVAGSVGLYNTRRGDYLVYGHETFGVDLEWYKEFQNTLGISQYANRTATVTLTEQPVEEGFVPYAAGFGGGVGAANETLQSITNPLGNAAILFVKPGHGTNDCDQSSAVVTLGPFGTLSGAGLASLYGSATPSLPITFVACVVASANVSSIPLRIVYFGPP
ncbi:MAG TPA: hypothetical protein VHV75_00110 [Solirubrobacteraceae bacterium]|nr:hypothetical protein [Solirubrobacteraceae bacterium]